MQEVLSHLNFHHLTVFRAVAKKLSYSRAAEELLISQPAVSRQVGALEREVGADLLGQVGNRVYLTEAGRVVLAYAERVAELTRETARALAELDDLERGYLRLGASSTPGAYLLPAVLAAFRAAHPGVDLTVRVANSQVIEEEVLAGRLDLGFVGARFLPGLQMRPYAKDELALVVAPGHPFAALSAVTPAQLAGADLVVREEGSGTRRVVDGELAPLSFPAGRRLELNGCEAVKHAAIAGLGAAVVSARSVALELRCGELLRVPVTGLKLERDLYVINRKDERPSAAALAFLALTRKTAVEPAR
ncbi:MAG: LysR family transcriptional regulator [Chloroflexi bacterium]|nr:LysR family transcriptional regulator [Chloroflexota bacterium]